MNDEPLVICVFDLKAPMRITTHQHVYGRDEPIENPQVNEWGGHGLRYYLNQCANETMGFNVLIASPLMITLIDYVCGPRNEVTVINHSKAIGNDLVCVRKWHGYNVYVTNNLEFEGCYFSERVNGKRLAILKIENPQEANYLTTTKS